MYRLLFIYMAIFLSSCAQEALKEEPSNNSNFDVELLFEYEGIKVYRFYDCGRHHWFTSNYQCINTHERYMQNGKTSYRIPYDEVIK